MCCQAECNQFFKLRGFAQRDSVQCPYVIASRQGQHDPAGIMMAMSIPAMHRNMMTVSHQLCSLVHNAMCLVDASGGSHLNDGKA